MVLRVGGDAHAADRVFEFVWLLLLVFVMTHSLSPCAVLQWLC